MNFIALLTLADIGFIPMFSVRSEKSIFALVTVDAFGVVAAILTNTSALVAAVNVERFLFEINFFRVRTPIRMSMAIASFN